MFVHLIPRLDYTLVKKQELIRNISFFTLRTTEEFLINVHWTL